jgi:2-polyprenyl-3-methyl-5-hydroxy-6-metoxy-1,4-benzoquinol methylase
MSGKVDAISEELGRSPALERVIRSVLQAWPEHEKFITTCLRVRSPRAFEHSERVAAMIERLEGHDIVSLCAGYRWMCGMVLEEELNFRRSGRYRCSSFKEATEAVYANDKIMSQYMQGLLLSQVLWSNHAQMLEFYIDTFLAKARPAGTLLEVGPGHGVLLALAAQFGHCAELTGWDVSATSLDRTSDCLRSLGVDIPTRLEIQNVFEKMPAGRRFDSVVISEVCEHLEQPGEALRALRRVMAPGGRIFVNMPINAAAIDHIYLLTTPEEVVDMVQQAGFEIEITSFAPAAGYSLEEARKSKISISVGVIGK